MIAKKQLLLLVLGACLLGLSAPGSQKNPVARPFKGYGEARGVFTLDENGAWISYEAFGQGNFTHLGRTDVHAVGGPDETGAFVIVVTLTAANGDQLLYAAAGPPDGEIPFIGGTGRFADATGSHMEYLEAVWTSPDPQTLVVDMAVWYEGTLVY